jgi:[lysine-biosynthesis-protein LysW]--L-2-aminoadipate ligase
MRIAIVADRVGWEERLLLAAAADRSARAFWLDDGDMCAGPRAATAAPADVYLIRSRSYTRGGALAGLLADGGSRVVCTPAAIAVCQDKLATARALAGAGLPVPDFRLVLTRKDLRAAIGELGLPCVLKPVFGGLGRRVLLIRDRDLADASYDYVEHYGQSFDRVLLAQRYHPGHDQRVIVAGPDVVAAYQRTGRDDWRANVATGAAVSPIPPGSVPHELAVAAATAAGAEVCAVDLLADPAGGSVICEVNHVPMFRGAMAASHRDIAGAIISYLLASTPVRDRPGVLA